MTEFNLSDKIIHEEFMGNFYDGIEIKHVKEFIRLLKEAVDNECYCEDKALIYEIDKLAGDKLQ